MWFSLVLNRKWFFEISVRQSFANPHLRASDAGRFASDAGSLFPLAALQFSRLDLTFISRAALLLRAPSYTCPRHALPAQARFAHFHRHFSYFSQLAFIQNAHFPAH